MLKKLSRRNAKRQALDYIIYIITLVITVVLMLSFNMVVFSDEISAIINEKSILPFMIVLVSIMVVFIMGVFGKPYHSVYIKMQEQGIWAVYAAGD